MIRRPIVIYGNSPDDDFRPLLEFCAGLVPGHVILLGNDRLPSEMIDSGWKAHTLGTLSNRVTEIEGVLFAAVEDEADACCYDHHSADVLLSREASPDFSRLAVELGALHVHSGDQTMAHAYPAENYRIAVQMGPLEVWQYRGEDDDAV